jgi:endonuclease G
MIPQEQIEKSKARLQFDPGNVREELGRNPPRFLSGPRRDNLIRAGVEPFDLAKERILGKNDLLNFNYFGLGADAGKCVGRVQIRDGTGQLIGFGTGFLVAPRLMITNNHVLGSEADAEKSLFEARYELGNEGRPLESVKFELRPEECFVTDKELDFTLVAIAEESRDGDKLSSYGWLQLVPTPGKAAEGESLSVIQHPSGDYKQVAIRENLLLKALDRFLWYQSDTAPGSSGSPVFNDQWEIVALHHAGVPAPDHPETGGYINEGILVRRIMEFVREQSLDAGARALADQLVPRESIPAVRSSAPPVAVKNGVVAGAAAIEFTMPLELTVQLRSPTATPTSSLASASGSAAMSNGPAVDVAPPATPAGDEKIEIDPDYAHRPGYDPAFLGSDGRRVELPTLPEAQIANAAIGKDLKSEPRYVLPYHHYSVVMNKERRLAFFTAVNIDGRLSKRLKREPDRWFFDPRILPEEQTGEPVYLHNKLDRGHLVRRLDPAWGDSDAVVKIANDDTFHFTNCTPQHKDFNENKASWAGLEDYILENSDNLDFKVNVFSGPVLADDDQEYRGGKLPKQFWKVVTMVKTNGQLSATGYVISQKELIEQPIDEKLEVAADFVFGDFRTFQVPVAQVEQLTGLSFGALSSFDPLAGSPLESTQVAREIGSHADVVL